MAKVYLVTLGYDYEGESVRFVHTNRRKAQADFDLTPAGHMRGGSDYVTLTEWDTNTQEDKILDEKGR